MPRSASLTTDDGRTLSWRESGSGPPVLLHPGGPGMSSRCFGELPELAAERTLLLLDPRGTGDSDRPADASAYDLADYAADIEAVRERLGLERLDLLGHSHGGFVAITWAGSHPDAVGRMVLANTAPRFTEEIGEARMARVASHQGQHYFEDSFAALRAHQEGRYETDEELGALYEREGRLFAPLGADVTAISEALSSAGHNADALRHFNQRISDDMDLRPSLAEIDAPTLVLTGELDPFGPSTAQEIAALLPDSTLKIIPGADHFAFLEPEHRGAWSRAVLDFLAD